MKYFLVTDVNSFNVDWIVVGPDSMTTDDAESAVKQEVFNDDTIEEMALVAEEHQPVIVKKPESFADETNNLEDLR